MAVIRFDVGTLDKPVKTPQGGIRAPAHLTRSGVFEYDAPDGKKVREYRPADEVFKLDSLASLAGAPLTAGHPPGFVSPDNFDKFSVGHVGDEVKQDGERVAAHVFIQGRKAIAAVEKGVREVSCGYSCRVDETPGVTPAGEPYDRVQRDISYNHVALVPVGRAGRGVRLRLDAQGEQVDPLDPQPDNREDVMDAFEVIDGTKYMVGSEAHVAACKRHDAADAERSKQVEALTAAKDKAEARADAAEAKLKDAEKQIGELGDSRRLDALVTKRLALVSQSRKVLGEEFKFDGLTDRQVQEAAIAKVAPELKLDGRTDDYVTAMFDAFAGEIAKKRADREGNGRVKAAATTATREDDDPFKAVRDARKKMIDDNQNAWNRASGKGV